MEETHAAMRSSLHAMADEVFDRRGYPNVANWQPVEAPARRRKLFFDGRDTLAAFIASVSDIDDLIPILTTFQIEWNKMHSFLSKPVVREHLDTLVAGAPWDEAGFQNVLLASP